MAMTPSKETGVIPTINHLGARISIRRSLRRSKSPARDISAGFKNTINLGGGGLMDSLYCIAAFTTPITEEIKI